MVEKKEVKSGDSGFGIAGFTLGILSIVLAGWIGMILGIIGFFLCFYQQRKNHTKIGKIGIILNIIGVVASIIFLFFYYKYIIPFIQQNLNGISDFPTS